LWGEAGQDDQTLGYGLIPLVLISMLIPSRYHERWVWFLAGSLVLVLALGPSIEIYGQSYNLPYRWLHERLNGVYRAPVRFLPIIFLTFAVFIGLTWEQHFHKITRRGHLVLIVMFIVGIGFDHHIFRSFHTYKIPHYTLYEKIGENESNVVVIEVPLSVANGWNAVGKYRAIEQYYGIYHEKRVVSGFVARENSNNYLYYELSPLWHWLAGMRGLDLLPAQAEWDKVLREFPIGYVIIRQDYLGKDHPLTLSWIQFMNTQEALCLVDQEADILVYRSVLSHLGCSDTPTNFIDVGEPASDLDKIGLGWYWGEGFGGQSSRWMGETAVLHFTLPDEFSSIKIQATGFSEERTIQVYLNDLWLGEFQLMPEGWQDFTFVIPQEMAGRITLKFVADSTSLSGDQRPISMAVAWIQID
jgi:hypothetical protein